MSQKYECKLEDFLKHVANHEIKIVKDDGLHRHIQFRDPKSFVYWIDIITWPEILCVNSDCGTFVFSRIEDMFEFFREPKVDGISINPGYWAKKLKAIDRDGYEEWSPEQFVLKVKDCFDEYEFENLDKRKECWEELKEEVLIYKDDEYGAMRGAIDFSFNGFQMDGAWEWGDHCKNYKYGFIWCLYAIVWGIKKYDDKKRCRNDGQRI